MRNTFLRFFLIDLQAIVSTMFPQQAMATLEARVMQDSHVMLVNALKTCCTSVAGDLFGEYLITEDVKAAMSLNIPDQEKAEKLIDSVRAQVANIPEKINVFIKVLRRNGIKDAAKKLEELLKGTHNNMMHLCIYH